MLPSVKNASGTETKVPSKREVKKGINIRWNSTTFFQLGLVVALLLSYFVIESDWAVGDADRFATPKRFVMEEPPLMAFQKEILAKEVPVKKVEAKPIVRPKVTNTFTVTPDISMVPETDLGTTEIVPDLPSTETTITAPPSKEAGPTNINTVQFVPIFPGCESLSNNSQRKACMSEKMNDLINRKFNTGKFSGLETGKVHTVNVMFTIGKDGMVKDIQTQAMLPDLEKEAERVIAKMPLMKPGKQGDKEVDVLFMIPIKFQIQ